VVHFESGAARDERAWTLGGNSRLPAAIRFLWCRAVDEAFHARYSAQARRYRYRIVNRGIPPALQRQWSSWERLPLDAAAMNRAAQALLGEHDFSAFRTVQCQAKHPRRNLHEIRVEREGEVLTIEVQANAFLHHMVRNIVGSLVPVGRGEQPDSWLGDLLRGRNRAVAGPTAPSSGLVFLGPRYPAHFGLPAGVSL
jgi:tRNA pseudouridine38-40 synthase